ncbi:MAG: glycosyltransferase family 87 protein [Baekduiaceae bacterium]
MLVALSVILAPGPNDGYTYWMTRSGDLYGTPWLEVGAYVYSPAFAQIIRPLTLMPFPAFWAVLVAVQVAALVAVARPFPALLVLVVPWLWLPGYLNPAMGTLADGNIDLLLAAVVAFAVTRPALWAFVLLTKVTPGVGVLWFAFRGEWRNLGLALGATLAVVAVSYAITPGLWADWIRTLSTSSGADVARMQPFLNLPLSVRLPVAVVGLAWGARTDRPWVVPLAAMLAMPQLGLGSYAVGLGALRWLPSVETLHENLAAAEVVVGRAAVILRGERGRARGQAAVVVDLGTRDTVAGAAPDGERLHIRRGGGVRAREVHAHPAGRIP